MSQHISLQELVTEIKNKALYHDHFVIALSGFGGSGKTTLSQKLSNMLGNTTAVHLDDFIAYQSSRTKNKSWDSFFDWDRLVAQVLQPIKDGKESIEYDVYDWSKDTCLDKKNVVLSKYIVVEGVKLIREKFKPFFDCSVWIDVPITVAVERGKRRDREEQGVDHDQQWDGPWAENDMSYFEEHHPEKLADYTVENI